MTGRAAASQLTELRGLGVVARKRELCINELWASPFHRMLGHKDAVQTLNRYGHLYPDERDSLAERLEQVHERARAAAHADRARTEGGPTVVQIGKGAGQ